MILETANWKSPDIAELYYRNGIKPVIVHTFSSFEPSVVIHDSISHEIRMHDTIRLSLVADSPVYRETRLRLVSEADADDLSGLDLTVLENYDYIDYWR